MGKVNIHEFDPVIYPFKLWICVTKNRGAIKDRFVHCDDRLELDTTWFDIGEAVVYYVEEREGEGRKGFLIVFMKRKFMTVKTIAHEATHAARKMWSHLGEMNIIGEESDAYLVGWIADCIYKVKTNRYG